MAYLRWAFTPFFCSIHYPLTFIFIVFWCLFSNSFRSNSTKKITVATATDEVEFHPIPWWCIHSERLRSSFVLFIIRQPSVSLLFSAYFKTMNSATEKKRTPSIATATAEGKCRSFPWWGIYNERLRRSFFRSFSANLHFHCCSALICFIFIILLLQYCCRVYFHNFTQYHNTTAAATENRVGTSFVVFFNLLSYNISQIFLSPIVICR